MMKRIDSAAVLLVVALFNCLSAPVTLVAASLEEKYFETRDNFIRQLSTELGKLAKAEEFYSSVFDWDAAVTHFAEVPVRTTNDKSFAYAFLGLWAQDIGPFPPKTLFVFFANGDRVFVVSTEAQSNIDQIAECKDVWDGFKKKSDAAFAAYQASELKEQKASDDMVRYEEEGFRAYCRCFEQRAKMEPFFKHLTEQAQTLVDNLQKQLPR